MNSGSVASPWLMGLSYKKQTRDNNLLEQALGKVPQGQPLYIIGNEAPNTKKGSQTQTSRPSSGRFTNVNSQGSRPTTAPTAASAANFRLTFQPKQNNFRPTDTSALSPRFSSASPRRAAPSAGSSTSPAASPRGGRQNPQQRHQSAPRSPPLGNNAGHEHLQNILAHRNTANGGSGTSGRRASGGLPSSVLLTAQQATANGSSFAGKPPLFPHRQSGSNDHSYFPSSVAGDGGYEQGSSAGVSDAETSFFDAELDRIANSFGSGASSMDAARDNLAHHYRSTSPSCINFNPPPIFQVASSVSGQVSASGASGGAGASSAERPLYNGQYLYDMSSLPNSQQHLQSAAGIALQQARGLRGATSMPNDRSNRNRNGGTDSGRTSPSPTRQAASASSPSLSTQNLNSQLAQFSGQTSPGSTSMRQYQAGLSASASTGTQRNSSRLGKAGLEPYPPPLSLHEVSQQCKSSQSPSPSPRGSARRFGMSSTNVSGISTAPPNGSPNDSSNTSPSTLRPGTAPTVLQPGSRAPGISNSSSPAPTPGTGGAIDRGGSSQGARDRPMNARFGYDRNGKALEGSSAMLGSRPACFWFNNEQCSGSEFKRMLASVDDSELSGWDTDPDKHERQRDDEEVLGALRTGEVHIPVVVEPPTQLQLQAAAAAAAAADSAAAASAFASIGPKIPVYKRNMSYPQPSWKVQPTRRGRTRRSSSSSDESSDDDDDDSDDG